MNMWIKEKTQSFHLESKEIMARREYGKYKRLVDKKDNTHL
jgi:hypothetical protein